MLFDHVYVYIRPHGDHHAVCAVSASSTDLPSLHNRNHYLQGTECGRWDVATCSKLHILSLSFQFLSEKAEGTLPFP